MTENNRYLSLMLAKGINRQFEPIVDWMRELSDVKTRLVELCLADESKKSLPKILDIFKSGLISRDFEVARYTCRLYSNMSYVLLENGALEQGY